MSNEPIKKLHQLRTKFSEMGCMQDDIVFVGPDGDVLQISDIYIDSVLDDRVFIEFEEVDDE